MKKLLALVFALVLLFAVTAVAEPITLQIGFENSISEPIGQALVKWQELVAEKGDGSIGAMSGSCKLMKESLAPEITEKLNATGFPAGQQDRPHRPDAPR